MHIMLRDLREAIHELPDFREASWRKENCSCGAFKVLM